MTTHKGRTVWLLIVMKGDRLLLEKNFHEGRNILQLPGGPSNKGIEALVFELFGIEYGNLINLRKVIIDDASDLQIPDDMEWCSKEVCISDPRGKRDARLYERLFEDSPLSLVYTEEQLEGW